MPDIAMQLSVGQFGLFGSLSNQIKGPVNVVEIEMKSFQAFLFIQVKFWYCENATKFEQKSPTFFNHSVGDVKTNWKIFQIFVEYLKFSLFKQVKFRYCENATKLGKTHTLF